MSDLPGLPLPGPRMPVWNELTNAQRVKIVSVGEYWCCDECSAWRSDAVAAVYNTARRALMGEDA